jgi:hypothetical protein
MCVSMCVWGGGGSVLIAITSIMLQLPQTNDINSSQAQIQQEVCNCIWGLPAAGATATEA